jgi:hypothetical protein
MTADLQVVHAPEHEAIAQVMTAAVAETDALLSRRWGLTGTRACEIHVLTSWERFVDETVPARYRPWVRISKPLWRGRAARTFAVAGGWMLPWPGRPAVGVKPPELLKSSATPMGVRLFEPVSDPVEKVRHLTCHEFTHACTAHLRLPVWLNEGLAMVAVDHLAGHQTVRGDTRGLVTSDPSSLDRRGYRRVRAGDEKALLRLYATGYWITRQLDASNASALRELLSRRRPRREVRRLAAEAFDSALVQAGAF